MLPPDFVEYAKKFEVGFLGTIGEGGPSIKLVRFEINESGVIVRGEGLSGGRACLAFANEEYVWKSENASVNGRLEKINEGEFLLVPERAVWTVSFDISKWPERIVRKWRK